LTKTLVPDVREDVFVRILVLQIVLRLSMYSYIL
jgi:hypothetical protein